MASISLTPTRSASNQAERPSNRPSSPAVRIGKFFPLWLLLPSLIILLVLQVYPTLYSFWLSTQKLQGGEAVYVGVQNFERLFRDTNFSRSLIRTVTYSGWYLALTVGIGLLLAVLLNRRIKFTGFYLILIFIPWVISDVVAGTIWRWMFQQSYGILQYWLAPLSERSLMVNPSGAMFIVVIGSVWRSTAFTTLLFLGALQAVPSEISESAAIDGANGWQTFWRIVFPLIRSTFLVAILMVSIQSLNHVGMILSIMGMNGGPGNSTMTIALYMLNTIQRDGDFGLAGANSVILFGINMVLTLAYLRLITVRKDGRE
jgi:ABC-type sugar transport system permease subunit